LADATNNELAEFLTAVSEFQMPLAMPADELLAAALAEGGRRRREPGTDPVAEDLIGPVVLLCGQLGQSSPSRAQLLALLARSNQPRVLGALVELVLSEPPTDDAQIVQALAPLFRRAPPPSPYPTAALFPRVFDGLALPQLAAPVLDLANYLTREGVEPVHPASSRSRQLTALLGELAQSLARPEESPSDGGLF